MEKRTEHLRNNKFMDYWPLICLVLVAALGATAIAYNMHMEMHAWMHYFMGLLFCQFAMLKLFNVSGFADGFQMYDLIAKQSRSYALSYPYIELVLGLAYLAFLFPMATYIITIILTSIGTIGVIKALRKGMNTHCVCMGTILKVPLSTVTLSEDLGMGIMALLMLIRYIAE